MRHPENHDKILIEYISFLFTKMLSCTLPNTEGFKICTNIAQEIQKRQATSGDNKSQI